eukprot:5331817-Amphidinium_carterae.1
MSHPVTRVVKLPYNDMLQVWPNTGPQCRQIGKTWPHIVASSDNGSMLLHGHFVRVESVESLKFVSPMQLRTVGPQRDGNAWDVGHVTYKAKRGRVVMIRSSLFAFGDFVDRAVTSLPTLLLLYTMLDTALNFDRQK